MSHRYESVTENEDLEVSELHDSIVSSDVVAVLLGVTIYSETPDNVCMDFETDPSADDKTIIDSLI